MADADRTTLSLRGIGFIERQPQAKREIHNDEIVREALPDCDCYTGTAPALTNAGIIDAHMLPGQPGRHESVVTIAAPDGMQSGPGSIEITRMDSQLFQVKVGISPEDSERRRQERARQLQAAEELEAALEREARELAAMPRSHERYRDDCVKTLRAHIKIVRDTAVAPNKYSGYHFDPLALRAFDDAAMQLLKTLLHGGTIFNAVVQERRIIEIRSPSSKANLPLQSFLQSIASQGNDAQQSTPDDKSA